MYAVLDIEATGGKMGEEAIIEIAIYRYDGKNITDQFISLVNPQRNIDAYVQKLTQITTKMVKTAPKFHEIAKRIVEITEDAVLVGHNVSFDYRMLRQEFSQFGYDYEKEWIDTFEFSEKLLPGMSSYSLGKLCAELGIPVSDRHRASGDARATLKLFQLLKDKDSEKIIIQRSNLPAHKDQKNKYQRLLKELPSTTGVFYFHNKDDEVIFIGYAFNIAQKVNRYFVSNKQNTSKIRKLTKRISFEETGSELISAIKAIHEIKKNTPILNQSNHKSLYPYGIYCSKNSKKYFRLEVGKLRKEAVLLRYDTKEKAQKALLKMMEDYALCYKINKIDVGENESCLRYDMQKCNGACIQKEGVSNYNLRVEELIKKTQYPDSNFVLIDKGRISTEKSFFLIQDGVFKGYGTFEFHHQLKDLKRIEQLIVPCEQTADIKNMIQQFLFNQKKPRLLSLPENTQAF